MDELLSALFTAGGALRLESDEVHVWRAPLEHLAPAFPRLHTLLSPDEQARCQRYCRERDRTRYGITRGVLRLLLARYCGLAAKAIAFTYSLRGKPGVAQPVAGAELQFSISHTDGMAVYAFTLGRRVGIDVECIRALQDRDQLVRRYFAPEEVEAYGTLPDDDRPHGFFNGWTRKEAFVKALGEGLARDLATFAVSLLPSEPPRLLRVDAGSPADWMLCDLTEAHPHIVALAVEGTGLRVRCLPWTTGDQPNSTPGP